MISSSLWRAVRVGMKGALVWCNSGGLRFKLIYISSWKTTEGVQVKVLVSGRGLIF